MEKRKSMNNHMKKLFILGIMAVISCGGSQAVGTAGTGGAQSTTDAGQDAVCNGNIAIACKPDTRPQLGDGGPLTCTRQPIYADVYCCNREAACD